MGCMGTLATVLVLSSASLHASWNLLVKRSRDTLAFLFLANLATLVVYALPFAGFLRAHPIPADGWPFVAATSTIHVAYYLCLSAAYTHGALSLAYPIARGTGVALVPLVALPLLREHVSLAGGVGIALVVAGILVMHQEPLRALVRQPLGIAAGQQSAFNLGTFFALLTGFAICGYSLVDKAGVARVPPVVYGYLLMAGMTLGLSPYILTRRRAALRREWTENRVPILVVGVLVLGTYLIILAAMRLTAVSYIVALREVSIVIGAVLGVWVLGEGGGRERIPGAMLILAGVFTIAVMG